MSSATANISLIGAMDLIKKSKHQLAPIYEAIANSLEAIYQNIENTHPEITLTFDFSGIISEVQKLNRIDITDNGIGFNSENYKRFETLLDKSKGHNNRGSGRIQMLHRFSRIEVVSYFSENGLNYKRTFLCNKAKYVYGDTLDADLTNHESGSTVSLIENESTPAEKEYFNNLQINDVIQDVKKHLLLRFYLDDKKSIATPVINIIFKKEGAVIGSHTIKSQDMPQPQETGDLKVSYSKIRDPKSNEIEWSAVPEKFETLKWAHFKLAENDLKHNGVYLCSKDIPVLSVPFRDLKKNESVDGHQYLTAFYGEILDNEKYVNPSVDNFCFPDKKSIEQNIKDGNVFFDENEEFIFFDDIKKEISNTMPTIYKDLFQLQDTQDKNVADIAKKHGIPIEMAQKANINLSDDEQKITDKLYKKQAEHFSKENQKIKKVFDELNKLDPTSNNYQQELETKSTALLEMIPQQNKEELGRYVIRREMVTKIIQMILKNELSTQALPKKKGKKRDKEGLIHDLIFKRKSANTQGLNDLWILNEEYVHFDGCSELPIRQIVDANGNKLLRDISEDDFKKYGPKTDRRPDIFLFAEEGKCILIELKALDVDLTDHLNQTTKYCNLIANFSLSKIERFYCYLIGENIDRHDLPGDFIKTVNDDYIKSKQPILSFETGKQDIEIASLQIEVIKLSSIYDRAHRRNKSFAEKLGLRDLI